MSDPRGKRKWAGPPLKDIRKAPAEYDEKALRRGDLIPTATAGVNKPPHKRLKVYTLKVEFVTETTTVIEKSYLTKSTMEQARKLLERDMTLKPDRYGHSRWSWLWSRDREQTRLKMAPRFTETMEDRG